MTRDLLAGVVALVLLGAAGVAGWKICERSTAGRITSDSTAAAHRADSVSASADSAIAVAMKRRAAETVARGLAEAEVARLRRNAAAHARADRDQDSALVLVTTPADSLPIVVHQRDEARAAAETWRLADSTDQVIIASQRTDSVAAAGVLRVTQEKATAREAVWIKANASLSAQLARSTRFSIRIPLLGLRLRPCAGGGYVTTTKGQGGAGGFAGGCISG